MFDRVVAMRINLDLANRFHPAESLSMNKVLVGSWRLSEPGDVQLSSNSL